MRILKRYWWFIALLVFSLLFMVQRMCSRSARLQQFSITHAEAVDAIYISNGGDSISIYRTSGGWALNNDPVDTMAVKSLFNVLSHLVSNSPVPSFQRDSLVDVAKRNGIRLMALAKGRAKLDFYAYYLEGHRNNVFVNNRTGEAYFVDLIGYTGDISGLFVAEKSYWTGSRLFCIPISTVLRVEVDIPQNPELSYIIGIANGTFELINKTTSEKIPYSNTDKLARFVDGLRKLTISKTSQQQLDTLKNELKNAQPMRVISLYSDAQSSLISLYPIKVDKINELGVKVEFDPNRFYVVYADNQIAEATYVNFSSLFWDIPDLVAKN